ncbi:Y-family DNA polymerase [Solimonas marina]|uniref:DNA polymerase Y family protein n=1 Tax=Solimonas marina TaxID=2714601 RepID=A0A969W6G3_9GAMM|nr:DNA polymerase Y family protein [Solimonas marina]NKF21282.1 DNA polymerase Y family protein [Solimonas marina]
MLWLCLYFPRLPAEALGLDDPLAVVTEQRGASRWLITDAAGIAAGTPLATALSLQPQLRAQARHVKAERAALLRLAHWIYRYGSPVHSELREAADVGGIPQALLWVEIAASLRLFGSYAALHAQLCADLEAFPQAASLAVAPTRAAAALFAVAGEPLRIRGDAALQRHLAAVPVARLPWPQAQRQALHGVGLRRLGDLYALPRAAFARRFGAARLRELDQLCGRAPEPAEVIVPPPHFQRRFELAAEVDHVEALLFPLRRLAIELQHWLRARDVGLRELRLVCTHAQRRRSSFTLRFGDAHRDGQRMLAALRERLGREPLSAPVRTLELHADEIAAADVPQGDLFAAADTGGEWTRALERIAARLGETAVWTPAPHADHRPEYAMRRASDVHDAADDARERPLWLLKKPLALPQAPPVTALPERLEGGWWGGADARRDYFAVDWRGARLWVYRDLKTEAWFVHGLWA